MERKAQVYCVEREKDRYIQKLYDPAAVLTAVQFPIAIKKIIVLTMNRERL